MSVDVDQMDEEFGCMGIHEKHKTNKGKGRDYVTVGNYEELQLAIAAYDKISIAVSQGSFHFYDDIVITNKQVEIYPAKEGQMPTFLSHGKNPLFTVEGGRCKLAITGIRFCNPASCKPDDPEREDNGNIVCRNGADVTCTRCKFLSNCVNGVVVTGVSKALFMLCEFNAHANGLKVVESEVTCLNCNFLFSKWYHIRADYSVIYLEECKLQYSDASGSIVVHMDFENRNEIRIYNTEFLRPAIIEIAIFHSNGSVEDFNSDGSRTFSKTVQFDDNYLV